MPYSSAEKRKKWVKEKWEKKNILISVRRSTRDKLRNLDLAKMGDSYDSLINKLIRYYSSQSQIIPIKSESKDEEEIIEEESDESEEEPTETTE
jgi:hypothetical protein